MRRTTWLAALSVVTLLAGPMGGAAMAAGGSWIEAYQSSPARVDGMTDAMLKQLADQLHLPPKVAEQMRPRSASGTFRYRFTVFASGSRLRVRLSNEVGTEMLHLTEASVALAAQGFDARPGSLKPLTFGGARGVAIPAGSPVVSDPLDMPVAKGQELLVSVGTADAVPLLPMIGGALALAPGMQTGETALHGAVQAAGRPLVTGVELFSDQPAHVIVALGDSITDGNIAGAGALHSWPEELDRRLAAHGPARYSVINAGIGGNRVLTSGWGLSALARLDRDVLRIQGVSHLILLEGTNDIGLSGRTVFGENPVVSADDIIFGIRQIIARAHARGIKVIVGTITPAGGSASHGTPEKQAVRDAVNRWIVTSHEADGVIDFARIVADRQHPNQISKEFDSGDHLHPNPSGYKAMGDGIDLSLFR